MAGWLILLIGLVYVVVALDLMAHGKVGLSIAFIGYALGNVGLWIAQREDEWRHPLARDDDDEWEDDIEECPQLDPLEYRKR